MPLKKRAAKKWKDFNLPLSYKINEDRPRLRDARNVFSAQGRLQNRFGYSRYNAVTLGGEVLSVSYFKMGDGTRKILAKIGTVLYSVAETGAHTAIKSGLTSTTKHRSITINYGAKSMCVIAIEGDGVFLYDGTTLDDLGQAVPSAPTLAKNEGAGTVAADDYYVKLSFYSSTLGWETNCGAASSKVTADAGNDALTVTDIPATAANAFIDTVYIYIKKGTADYVYDSSVALGTVTKSITTNTTNTDTEETTHGDYPYTGAKYLAHFNNKLVVAGDSTYPHDVAFSETDLINAWDDTSTQLRLFTPGQGPITGLAIGFFNDSVLDPYLIIFKSRSIHIYSEVGDYERFTTISNEIGCVSDKTISIRNGVIYFLSASGWRAINNGKLITDPDSGETFVLGREDLQDIFNSPGYTYELNKANFDDFFSVYYSELDQYITWVSESGNESYYKSYVFQFDIGGFTSYSWTIPATCACTAEDSSNNEVVLFGDGDGFLYTHSIDELRTDVDEDNTATAFDAFAIMTWFDGDDLDSSYNFRKLMVRAIESANDVSVKTWINYNLTESNPSDLTFTNDNGGFQLDFSHLDEDVLGDDRDIGFAQNDLNIRGRNLSVGFYQCIANANMNLIAMQIDFNKNGNNNV